MEKWPLIILHNKRTRGGPADNPYNKQLLEGWRKAGALYTTPTGSNDDWYWLYAAVRCKCFLVTNDEMRDHLFELLGNEFFSKWKERHQVRFTFSKYGPQLHMPPPYSIVIQESERGSWHIPIKGGDDIETTRSWLCVTRPDLFEIEQQVSPIMQDRKSQGQSQCSGLSVTNVGTISQENAVVEKMGSEHNADMDFCSDFCTQTVQLSAEAGKRKRRSSSPSCSSSEEHLSKIRK
eukprot:Gb_37044 [translate_table: standard]